MSEPGMTLATLGDDQLGSELQALAAWLDGPTTRPTSSPDPARRARLRIEAGAGRPRAGWWPRRAAGLRPLRRSFVLAVVALVVLAAIAGAIGFGVPGIRIIFTGPTPSPSIGLPPASAAPSPSASASPAAAVAGPPGTILDLGFLTNPTEAPGLTGFAVELPQSPSVGPPDAMWFTEGRLTLVWKARPGLPETQAAGIGLLVTEFRGRIETDLFQKVLGPGSTLTPATVGDATGWWISGAAHEFMYLDPNGEVVADRRRLVGDTLIWTRGDLTFRMETSLGLAAAIGLAETVH